VEPSSFELTVSAIFEETTDARSIAFDVPEEARELFAYRPGQFLTLAIPSAETGSVARCYSLCSSPVADEALVVTVKRTLGGYASNWIVDQLRLGDRLRVLPPAGTFCPASLDDDFLLFAGGSGVTPIYSIARSALLAGTGKVALFYANRDEASVIFAEELRVLADRHPDRFHVVHWLESVQGLPSAAHLRAFAEAYQNRNGFVCGPGPFMEAATKVLHDLGFPRERRHQEKFKSLGGNPFGDVDEAGLAQAEIEAADAGDDEVDPGAHRTELTVELDGRTHQYEDWRSDMPLLNFLESKGLKAPFSCREGECSACEYLLVSGEVTMRRNEVLEEQDLAEGYRLGCQSLPASKVVAVKYT
jgi:3-ketosteroid 9alpha-monooxygenase subunit B